MVSAVAMVDVLPLARDSQRTLGRPFRPCYKIALAILAIAMAGGIRAQDAVVDARNDLDYRSVLFEYFQGDNFNGLIEYEFAANSGNPRALSDDGQLLKGGMALSYGLADMAETTFDDLLATVDDETVRNRAWYYLARLYYARSQPAEAARALARVQGRLPMDLYLDYHYLATLVHRDSGAANWIQQAVTRIPGTSPQYPYLLFNLAVSQLSTGERQAALDNLNAVIATGSRGDEFQILADRARHGLAQIAMQEEQLGAAWQHLQAIRTQGLYSNRALLAYAWTAMRQGLHGAALPALELLNRRSIALPEVQQGKVLIGHLYEQRGSVSRALRSHLDAEAALLQGIDEVAKARALIEQRNVPRDFIANLDAIVDESDWFAMQPSLNASMLTPFLMDLMASNVFDQVLRQLGDLYAIRDNLAYWGQQTAQHTIILESAEAKIFDDNMKQVLATSAQLHQRLLHQRKEQGLLTLTLPVEDQLRFDALLDNSSRELALLSDKLRQLQKRSEPYRQPLSHRDMVRQLHQRIEEHRQQNDRHIATLEAVMRNLIGVELDEHEERMRYYLVQARLAKARLYDTALSNLDGASGNNPPTEGGTP